MTKTVALVLAGGNAPGFDDRGSGIDKPLLPVWGKPVALWVIQSLEQSDVEALFILYAGNPTIPRQLGDSEKRVYIDTGSNRCSFGDTLVVGLQKMVEYYGSDGLGDRTVMIVPCDIPLIEPRMWDALIRKLERKQADIVITIIGKDAIHARFPGLKVHSAFLAEYGANYTTQNIVFVNGKILGLRRDDQRDGLRLTVDGWDENTVNRFVATLDSLRNRRGRALQIVHFVYEFFVRRALAKRCFRSVLTLIADLTFKRFTMDKAMRYLNRVFDLRIDYIESDNPEYSVDIDTPADLERIRSRRAMPSRSEEYAPLPGTEKQ